MQVNIFFEVLINLDTVLNTIPILPVILAFQTDTSSLINVRASYHVSSIHSVSDSFYLNICCMHD